MLLGSRQGSGRWTGPQCSAVEEQDLHQLEELRRLEREASAEQMRGHSVFALEFTPRASFSMMNTYIS